MPVSEQTREVIALLKAERVISVISAPIRRLGDARSLILLSQMVYWTTRDRTVQDAGGWFSKPVQDWIKETGLTRAYVASCMKVLQERRIVKVWQRMTKTAPWYKLDLGELYALSQGRPSEGDIPLAQFIADQAYRDAVLGRPLPYFTLLTKVAGGDALLGLFLSRCVYWQELLEQRNRLNARKPTWGWSSNDWANDIGITRAQLRNVLKQAAELKLIDVTTADRPFPGIWVNFDQLHKAIIMPSINVFSVPKNKEEPSGRKCRIPTADAAFTATLTPSINGPAASNAPIVKSGQSVGAENVQPSAEFSQEQGEIRQEQAGFEQSTRACGFDSVDYTTTTTSTGISAWPSGVVVMGGETLNSAKWEALGHLIYPPSLADRSVDIRKTIAAALPHRRQILLDELEGQIQRGIPRNPISYLRGIVQKDNDAKGELVMEYAHLAEKARVQARLIEQQRAASIQAAKAEMESQPPSPKEQDPDTRLRRSQELRALRQQLSTKSTTTPSEENVA